MLRGLAGRRGGQRYLTGANRQPEVGQVIASDKHNPSHRCFAQVVWYTIDDTLMV